MVAAALATAAAQAGSACFDLKGTATAPGTVSAGVGQDRIDRPVMPGDEACAILTDIKNNWDALPPAGSSASGPVTRRPDGTCDWCVTRYRNQKPTEQGGRMIAAAGMGRTPGLSQLSQRFVPNPPPVPPPPPVTIKIQITVNVLAPAGGGIRIQIEIEINGVIQPILLHIPTAPGMTPDQVNQEILRGLQQAGFTVQPGQNDFLVLGPRPCFDILGHASGARLHGVELETFDDGLSEWGLAVLAPGCPGDLTGDSRVDEADLGVLLANWYLGPGGDTNGDGETDEADLGIVLANWRQFCP